MSEPEIKMDDRNKNAVAAILPAGAGGNLAGNSMEPDNDCGCPTTFERTVDDPTGRNNTNIVNAQQNIARAEVRGDIVGGTYPRIPIIYIPKGVDGDKEAIEALEKEKEATPPEIPPGEGLSDEKRAEALQAAQDLANESQKVQNEADDLKVKGQTLMDKAGEMRDMGDALILQGEVEGRPELIAQGTQLKEKSDVMYDQGEELLSAGMNLEKTALDLWVASESISVAQPLSADTVLSSQTKVASAHETIEITERSTNVTKSKLLNSNGFFDGVVIPSSLGDVRWFLSNMGSILSINVSNLSGISIKLNGINNILNRLKSHFMSGTRKISKNLWDRSVDSLGGFNSTSGNSGNIYTGFGYNNSLYV